MKIADFTDRLIAYRRARGLLKSELARAAGLSGAQMTRLEQGLHWPRADTLRRLANALRVRIDELI